MPQELSPQERPAGGHALEALAVAILNSEPFMWLMVGANHPEAHLKALRPAYDKYRALGGGFNAKAPAASSSAFGSEVVGGEADGPSAEDRQQRAERPQPPTTADAASPAESKVEELMANLAQSVDAAKAARKAAAAASNRGLT